MNPIEILTEKHALKELVDTFSNLADEKKVAEQGFLFTEDAHVTTYIGGEVFADMSGREAIVQVFSDFLANFDSVYHLNGQFTVSNLTENSADAINYCHVVLTQKQDGKTLIHNHYVRYNDSYAKVNGTWLIKRRIADFMVSDARELGMV